LLGQKNKEKPWVYKIKKKIHFSQFTND